MKQMTRFERYARTADYSHLRFPDMNTDRFVQEMRLMLREAFARDLLERLAPRTTYDLWWRMDEIPPEKEHPFAVFGYQAQVTSSSIPLTDDWDTRTEIVVERVPRDIVEQTSEMGYTPLRQAEGHLRYHHIQKMEPGRYLFRWSYLSTPDIDDSLTLSWRVRWVSLSNNPLVPPYTTEEILALIAEKEAQT